MNTDASLSELTKALLSLEGLLHGITADDIINQKELEMLKKWKRLNYEKIRHHPAGDLVRMLDSVMDCQILQKEDRQFIHEFCREYGACEEEENSYSCDLVRMQGYIQGILADSKIYAGEIRSFLEWLQARPHLSAFDKYEPLIEASRQFLSGEKISGKEFFRYLSGLFPIEYTSGDSETVRQREINEGSFIG